MGLATLASPRQWSRSRVVEYAKTELRNALHRHNLDLVRDPASSVLIRALRWLDVDTVIDVGANVGQFASGIRSSGFTGRILSCEPLPDAYAQLVQRASKDGQWKALNTALGADNGFVSMNISANSYSSSVLTITQTHLTAAPASHITGSVKVPLTRLVDVVRAEAVDPARTLLKVDTQGYEGPVLDGAGDLLADFPAIQLELSMLPLYEGQALFAHLLDRLQQSGHTLFSLDPGFADPITGRMLQCDGLFVKESLLDGGVSR
jgi:FkbM family methyltransferase